MLALNGSDGHRLVTTSFRLPSPLNVTNVLGMLKDITLSLSSYVEIYFYLDDLTELGQVVNRVENHGRRIITAVDDNENFFSSIVRFVCYSYFLMSH
jgi:hypothetical protein